MVIPSRVYWYRGFRFLPLFSGASVRRLRRRLRERERERENNLTHFLNYWHKVYVHMMSLVKRAWLPTTSWERFTDLSLLSGQRIWLAMPKNGVKNSLWMMYLNTTTKLWAQTIREKILLLLMLAIFKVEVPLQNCWKMVHGRTQLQLPDGNAKDAWNANQSLCAGISKNGVHWEVLAPS